MRCSTEDGLRLIGHGGAETVAVTDGWELLGTPAGAATTPDGLPGDGWAAAVVPGTVAGALGPDTPALDERDWWFRVAVTVPEGGGWCLVLDGVATIADVYLDGELVLRSESMFLRRRVPLGDREGPLQVAICCRALAPLLAAPRRPRARWRTRLADNALRWQRTMLLGRCPGFAPGPAVVGPFRPVRLERHGAVAVTALALRAALDGDDGRLTIDAAVRAAAPVSASMQVGDGPAVPLTVGSGPGGELTLAGEARVPSPERWWPHTHGTPALHRVTLTVRAGAEETVLDAGAVGFRDLRFLRDPDAPAIEIGGTAVFVRGVVLAPTDLAAMPSGEAELRPLLERLRDGGINLVRIAGTGAYEAPAFHDLCDELGILVWQDFAFANFDYPGADPAFTALVREEVAQVLGELGHRPSLAVLCGNSEVEQQAAMLGADATGDPLFTQEIPGWVAGAGVPCDYLPSAPTGGTLPFRPGAGVANYFGVGGYRRPLADARSTGVRFASECLAFANVPDDAPSDLRAGVPRDAGADWDFADVRDHYLAERYGVDPVALAAGDRERYLALSRQITGELIAAVFGEWRRAASPCAGGIVLWGKDLEPGSGWGLLDHAGAPKVAFAHLRRIAQPVALWLSDEGLGGVVAHVANDTPEPVTATLRVGAYDGAHAVETGSRALHVPARSVVACDLEDVLGRFLDLSYAYRFGPPQFDAVLARLDHAATPAPAVFFPAGPPVAAGDCGLRAALVTAAGGPAVRLQAGGLAWGVRVAVPGCAPADDAFCLEPGEERIVALRGRPAGPGQVTALNAAGPVPIAEGP